MDTLAFVIGLMSLMLNGVAFMVIFGRTHTIHVTTTVKQDEGHVKELVAEGVKQELITGYAKALNQTPPPPYQNNGAYPYARTY